MSGTRNANITLVEVKSHDSVGLRKAAQVLAVAVLSALFAVPVASAAIRPAATALLPGNVHTPGVQSEPGAPPAPRVAPVTSAAIRPAATALLPGNVHTPGVQSEPGAPPAPRVAHRIYDLGSLARTSTLSPAKVKAKTSTLLKPTAVKIAANPTGGSANKVQQVFSIH
jgi:hypothetical protein